ncbi:O-acetyl-ADP-ribose deacetylase (regulator of RNase III), contains Macro domain [Saccharicrinis carchari]|uniref:O-acetyl-ADP-ribose deacetylase (Regulator of RNase III), contains Macro domain n=1 Tax=Saccharicrinis carchari TaxID=1168039 RepID=A0A521D048_SACCC|nr:O-acetyl-ADP-ribose deacetylase [Saccharicrinis carchari]SMO65076.1 O-acetyl-ADP-ribose deacetylase (regulator of RNase III), contains Macro domain [Saccharicrinis carchari]
MKIEVIQADITKLAVDAIVNAAKSSLMGGGGVDGAIHRAGGPSILAECKVIRNRQGDCPAGEAVITGAGKLPAQYVIHTVGPIWNGGDSGEPEKLRNCYLNALKLAAQHDVKTIAFSNISTGVYGYPKKQAAQIALSAVKSFKAASVQKVIFACFDEENYDLYKELVE